MQHAISNININYSLSELKIVRAFIYVQLHSLHVSDNDINMITLSVDEVCANLIIHAQKTPANNEIEITLFKEDGGIRVNILDHGISFNPINYKEKNLDTIVSEKRKGGIGLILVNKIMDKIEYHIEETYNVCSMFKKVTLC